MSENLFRNRTDSNENEFVEIEISENEVSYTDLESLYPPIVIDYEMPEGIGDSIDRLDEAGQSNMKFVQLPSGHFIRIHEDYTPVDTHSRKTTDDVADSWFNMEYPVGNSYGAPRRASESDYEGIFTNHSGFDAHQFSDGSGEVTSMGERVYLRTKNGLVIEEEWHPSRIWRQTNHVDARLPLSQISTLLNTREGERVFDIERIFSAGRKHLLEFRQGFGVFIGWDKTARRTGQNSPMFALRIEADEMEEIRTIDDVERRLLTPQEVHDVIGTPSVGDRYKYGGRSQIRLTEDEPSEWSVKYGNNVFRQGEWFFIPMSNDFEPDGVIYKPLSAGADPATVPEFTVFDGDLPAGRYEATTYNHRAVIRDLDSGQFLVPPTIFPASYPRDMGSHVPRDLFVTTLEEKDANHNPIVDEIFVRGTVRHVEGDHPMINLRERWYKAVTHDREVLSVQAPRTRRMGWD